MKTTPEHFERFKQEFNRYVDMFGLKGWDIRFVHLNATNIGQAWVMAGDLEDRIVTVGLNKNVSSDIDSLAKHEALELLLHKLDHMAKNRYVTLDLINEERHNVITVLEHVIK